MTTPGAAARRKGHEAERKAVRWLRDHGYPDARTTRSALGHDGFDQTRIGDLDAIPGIAIDVKAANRLEIPDWLRQVRAEAGPDRLPLLWVWRPGLADPGDWWAIARWADLHDTIGDCLA